MSAELKRVEGGRMYRGTFYPEYLFVGGGGYMIRKTALSWCSGRGVDIGAGFWPLPGAVPIDKMRGEGADNRIEDVEDMSLDFVFSSHTLEHIEGWEGALRVWHGKLKIGGNMFLYLPHPSCEIWHRGSPVVGDDHKWRPEFDILYDFMTRDLRMNIPGYDKGPDHYESFYIIGRRAGL